MNSCEKSNKIDVLFLTCWYPTEEISTWGIFVKRHAEAVSKYCGVAIFHPYIADLDKKHVDYFSENNIITVQLALPRCRNSNIIIRNIKSRTVNNFYFSVIHPLQKIFNIFGKPDIIHVHVMSTFHFHMAFFAYLLSKILNVPFIITEHCDEYYGGVHPFLRKILTKFSMGQSELITADSTSMIIALKKIKKSARYQVVPNVVNINNFTLDTSRRNISERNIILHVSRFRNIRKNITGLFDAIELIRMKRDDFELHLIGDSEERDILSDYAEKKGLLNTYIFFHGVVSDQELCSWYQKANFFVLCSNKMGEGFGVVLIEAMACGLPILSTKSGGPEDIVTDEVGLLIDPEDTLLLANSIEYMLDNWNTYDPYIISKIAKERYSYEKIGDTIFNLYMEVLEKRK